MEMDEGSALKQETGKSNLLFNPLVIWALTSFFSYTVGSVFVADLIDWAFLSGDGIWEKLFRPNGLCGVHIGVETWYVPICRLFFPFGAILFDFGPFLLITLLIWIYFSLRNRSFLKTFSRQQPFALIFAYSLLGILYTLISINMFAQYALFTGLIHGFHPLLPTVNSFFSFATPIFLWLLIDTYQYRNGVR